MMGVHSEGEVCSTTALFSFAFPSPHHISFSPSNCHTSDLAMTDDYVRLISASRPIVLYCISNIPAHNNNNNNEHICKAQNKKKNENAAKSSKMLSHSHNSTSV